MKRFITIVAALLLSCGFASPSFAAWSLVAHTSAEDTFSPLTSGAIDTTGADFLVVVVTGPKVATAVITDSKGNSWTALTSYAFADAGARVWYVAAATVGSGHTFTMTDSGGTLYGGFVVQAWSGGAVSSVFDQGNGISNGSSTSLAPGSITPTEDDELIITGFNPSAGSSGNPTIDGGFTVNPEYVTTISGLAYLVQTSAAAANPTWTIGSGSSLNGMAAVIASFKAAGSSAPVLSSATPSGTLGTSTTATVGATSDTTSGDFFTVLELTSGLLTSITGPQIEAGDNNTDAAADFANDATVTDTSPEVGFTGLAPSTTYYYASVQKVGSDYSNVVTGSFTTAAAPTNSADFTPVVGGEDNQTFDAGFSFTAGRQAVVQISYYMFDATPTGVTIGGTAATLISRASNATDTYGDIWAVLGAGVAGGTNNVVVQATTDPSAVYMVGGVTEWAAGTFGGQDAGTANDASGTGTAPTVSTAISTSHASTVVFATLVADPVSTQPDFGGPTGYTALFTNDVDDDTSTQFGRGAWKEETTTGTKTALFSATESAIWGVAIAALKIGGATSALLKIMSHRQQMTH